MDDFGTIVLSTILLCILFTITIISRDTSAIRKGINCDMEAGDVVAGYAKPPGENYYPCGVDSEGMVQSWCEPGEWGDK